MMRRRLVRPAMLCGTLLLAASGRAFSAPPAEATAAFGTYAAKVEARLARQHGSRGGFLAGEAMHVHGRNADQLRRDEPVLEQISPDGGGQVPGGLLHHWRGTAFIQGARATDFLALMEDFRDYPERFQPQVLRARVLARRGSAFQVAIRVRQKHGLTVVLDTDYDVHFVRLDSRHGYSISRSTRIAEVGGAGTAAEHELGAKREHGFLWRLNTYWSYEKRDGGLYVQIETISLTRTIPRGLGWIVGPFVESIPRDSLEFTLRSVCGALRR